VTAAWNDKAPFADSEYHDTAGVFHVYSSGGAIRPGAGEDYCNQMFTKSLRGARQQHIDRWLRSFNAVFFKIHVSIDDLHVPV